MTLPCKGSIRESQKLAATRQPDQNKFMQITINRPEKRNAFRPQTVEEIMRCMTDARDDPAIGVIILTGKILPELCKNLSCPYLTLLMLSANLLPYAWAALSAILATVL